MSARFNRQYLAGRFVAQEARRDVRAGDLDYARGEGRARFQQGTEHVDTTPALERDVLAAVLDLLRVHPRVAWARRMNTGGVERENQDGSKRYIAFAFTGCADILGQLKDGRLLAVECKRPDGRLTDDQRAFLVLVARYGGVAIVARNVDNLLDALLEAGA